MGGLYADDLAETCSAINHGILQVYLAKKEMRRLVLNRVTSSVLPLWFVLQNI